MAAPANTLPATDTWLRVTEIFYSLQGEADSVGWPTVFVRLTGCPLRCQYCDTAYAFEGGRRMEIDAILAQVAEFGTHHVCVTGGEPLAQKRCLKLLSALCNAGFEVSLETSGALDIDTVDPRVRRVVDLKTPGSLEAHRTRWANLQHLTPRDQIKFVICDYADFRWACGKVAEYDLSARCPVLFSPSHGQLDPPVLADWILAERLPVRFQVQLHKLLWGDTPGR